MKSASSAAQRVKGGSTTLESESFDQIYRTYFDPVYRYVLSLSRKPELAEEITQETFFKAMRSLDKFRGGCSVKSWLCSIARNLLIDQQRKKKPQSIAQMQDLPDTATDLEASLVQQDESMRIHHLLHHLAEPYREVFTLRALGQLSFRDIGEIFGKSTNWACVVYHRARASIKQKMEE